MANNIDVKDAAGATQTFKTTNTAGVHAPHHNVDSVPADPFGANADAVVAAGASGSISAKLRAISRDLVANIVLAASSARIGKVTIRNSADAADIDPLAESTFTGRIGEVQASPTANTVLDRLKALLTGIVLAAGTAIIGKVGIDQTTPGTTDSVSVATGQGAGAAIGATSGAAVITDANGTIQQYLRGLIKLWIAGGLGTKEIRSATPSQSSVADTASSTTLLASNASRLGATIYNDSTVALYLKLGGTASTTSYTVQIAAGGYYEVPFGYTGIIDGIWASDASGSARITELT